MPLSIVALIAARNEGDVISHVIEDLVSQGISVYLLDDGSTDDTVERALAYHGQGLIAVEHLRETLGPARDRFEWSRILDRKSQLAAQLDADWFIHHDADEFREAPWPNVTFRDGIHRVDALGFNAIDFALFDFLPTDNSFQPGTDVRKALTRFKPGASYNRSQVRCWKRISERVDLVTSGGHDASFPGRRVFPLRFLLRHYPIRSQFHGQRKVLEERQPRFLESERRIGWHVQYDVVHPSTNFLQNVESLCVFDPDRARLDLLLSPPEMEARVEALRRERIAREGELISARAERDSALAAITHLEAELLKRTEALAAVETSLKDLGADFATWKRAYGDREHEAEALKQALEVRLSEIAELRANALSETRRVEALHASLSWRVTRPLRAAYEIMAGAPPGDSTGGTTTGPASSPSLKWGDFGRLSPISNTWGTDRGLPVDRYYIHRFLKRQQTDIRGSVLEVKDANYARHYGGDRVTYMEVVDIDANNPAVTIVADLTRAEAIDSARFDCVILTQTLHIIYDIHAAVREVHRMLRSGGVLLATVPAVSRVNFEDGGLVQGDFWRLTRAAAVRLFGDVFGPGAVTVETSGNVRVSAAFLYGLSVEDLDDTDLAFDDPWFPLIHCIRAQKS